MKTLFISDNSEEYKSTDRTYKNCDYLSSLNCVKPQELQFTVCL